MTRSYAHQDMVTLPVLGSSDTVVLTTGLTTAYITQERALKEQGQTMPSSIVRSKGRLDAASTALSQALRPLDVDSQAAVSADAVLDDAWGALRDWLTGWSRLPASRFPAAGGVAALHRLIFGQGLSFLILPFRNEWQESQSRIEVLTVDSHRALIVSLGGVLFLENLVSAHNAYGAALGITAPVAASSPEVREHLRATLDALRDYVLKVRASIEPDDPATEALAEALLAPLVEWQSPSSSSSSASSASSASPSGAEAGAATSP